MTGTLLSAGNVVSLIQQKHTALKAENMLLISALSTPFKHL